MTRAPRNTGRKKRATRQTAARRRKRATVDRVLIYYDGPQVLTLDGPRNDKWIGVKVTAEYYDYPIFCVPVTKENLSSFLRGQVDLRYLFRYGDTKDYRVVDLAREEDDGKFALQPTTPLSSWFPDTGFFLDPDDVASNAEEGRDNSPSVQTIGIDGEWELPDFSVFSDLTTECYSFLYSINTIKTGTASEATIAGVTSAFDKYPWQGGGSPLHLYNDLYKRTPANDRLNVRRLKYASPGEIELEGNANIFNQISKVLAFLEDNYRVAQSEYRDLHAFLSKEKLLTAGRETIRGTVEVQKIVEERLTSLAGLIGFEELETLYAKAEKNWILTAKILLSFYRRLRRLFRFYAEGRAGTRESSAVASAVSLKQFLN